MKIAYAAVAQSVERRIGSAEVTGPIPVSSFKWEALVNQGFFVVLKQNFQGNPSKSRPEMGVFYRKLRPTKLSGKKRWKSEWTDKKKTQLSNW